MVDNETTAAATEPRRRRRLVPLLLVLGVLAAAAAVAASVVLPAAEDDEPTGGAARGEEPAVGGAWIWLTGDELAALPTEGPAWSAVATAARGDWGEPDLGDNDDRHDVLTLAGALYAARLDDVAMADRVRDALDRARSSESAEVLPVARNVLSYVVAADLIGYDDPAFEAWLLDLLDRRLDGRAGLDTLRESALRDPSNHGTHARATVLAIAMFTDDLRLTATIADRFHDWLGRSSEGFEWRELDWQADPERPVGINAPQTAIESLDVDGVLPEEQRRSGGFADPPPREGYVWEALQGAVVTAELLGRAGYDPWAWEDEALLRAYRWLHVVAGYPAEGDDRWQPWLVNARYGSDFPATAPTEPGKNMGYTDWTHGPPRR